MSDFNLPKLYIISPPIVDPLNFPNQLSEILESNEISCFRLSLASKDEDAIIRIADTLRELLHARNIPLIIEDHYKLVKKIGLDGVHLTDGARSVKYVRKELGADYIIGSYCSTSKHNGLLAAENGADYISFGPLENDGLGNSKSVPKEIFEWWSEIIEVPVVVEGNLKAFGLREISKFTDFIAFGEELWGSKNPNDSLQKLQEAFIQP